MIRRVIDVFSALVKTFFFFSLDILQPPFTPLQYLPSIEDLLIQNTLALLNNPFGNILLNGNLYNILFYSTFLSFHTLGISVSSSTSPSLFSSLFDFSIISTIKNNIPAISSSASCALNFNLAFSNIKWATCSSIPSLTSSSSPSSSLLPHSSCSESFLSCEGVVPIHSCFSISK